MEMRSRALEARAMAGPRSRTMRTGAKNGPAVAIAYLGDHRETIPVIASWIYNEWSFLYAGRTEKYIENLLQNRVHKRKLPMTLVAFDRGRPVGTVSLKEKDMEERPDLSPWITSLYVAPR